MRQLRLTHPSVDFWIDVRLRQLNGRWLAVADLADEPDIGLGIEPTDALWQALASFPVALRCELLDEAARLLASDEQGI